MIDRGFIKWQPFNSLTNAKDIINDLKRKEILTKPLLFPEEIENLNQKIINAYYDKSFIILKYYEESHIYELKTKIKEIYPNYNTLKLSNNKVISFNQIIQIN